ncbi:MAG: hypothetical protein RBJ76_04065 [Stenomitos frigidus ULC029]
MLRPEHCQFASLDRLPTTSDYGTKQSTQSLVLANTSELDTLVESLMPKDISASKQAIIERLITMWATASELDVA